MKKNLPEKEIEDSVSRVGLEVTTSTRDNAKVLSLKGDLVASEVIHFRQACGRAEKENCSRWIVDLTHVNAIDGYGLASLVGLLSRTKSLGSRLVVCGVNPNLRSSLEATMCDGLFEITFTQTQALESLKFGPRE